LASAGTLQATHDGVWNAAWWRRLRGAVWVGSITNHRQVNTGQRVWARWGDGETSGTCSGWVIAFIQRARYHQGNLT